MAHLQKPTEPTVVVNIIPPRGVWDPIQRVRMAHIGNARCGPHLTLIEPFIVVEQLDEAVQLLSKALAAVEPFEVSLARFGFFRHPRTSTLYLDPSTSRDGAFEELIQCGLAEFPQCNNLVVRGGGKYIPHMSLGQFRSFNKMKALMEELESDWKEVTFPVSELFVGTRQGIDPLELYAVIPLGKLPVPSNPPHFGAGSFPAESQGARTLVLFNIPELSTDESVAVELKKCGIGCGQVEVLQNPKRKPRPIVLLEFSSSAEMRSTLARFTVVADPRPAIPFAERNPYARPLEAMLFPLPIASSTTLRDEFPSTSSLDLPSDAGDSD